MSNLSYTCEKEGYTAKGAVCVAFPPDLPLRTGIPVKAWGLAAVRSELEGA